MLFSNTKMCSTRPPPSARRTLTGAFRWGRATLHVHQLCVRLDVIHTNPQQIGAHVCLPWMNLLAVFTLVHFKICVSALCF